MTGVEGNIDFNSPRGASLINVPRKQGQNLLYEETQQKPRKKEFKNSRHNFLSSTWKLDIQFCGKSIETTCILTCQYSSSNILVYCNITNKYRVLQWEYTTEYNKNIIIRILHCKHNG